MRVLLQIGNSRVMLSDMVGPENEGYVKSPADAGGVTSTTMIYVADVDAAFAHALASGATVIKKLEDQFWGDRT